MAKETWDLIEDRVLVYDKDKYEIISTSNRGGYSHFDNTESWDFYILAKKMKTKGNMEVWAIFDATEIHYDSSYYDEDLAGTTEKWYRNDLIYDIGSEEEIMEVWEKLN